MIYGIHAVSFCHYYFVKYPAEVYPQEYFAGEYSGLIEYIDENIEESKEVYVLDSSYIYYLVSSQRSPYTFDTSDEDWGKRCLNFHFDFDLNHPETIDFERCVYIVRETYGDAIEVLEKYDAEYCEYGMYRLYYKK